MKDYILFVGQAFPRRHLNETILACKKLGIELITAGTGKHDHVSDAKLEELYRNTRLFVYVSDTEAFGLPPLEALARGVRPVVADTPVSHELFGDDAIYCQPTVDGIAEGIHRGLDMPKPNPTNKFSWKDHTDRFLNLCQNLAK